MLAHDGIMHGAIVTVEVDIDRAGNRVGARRGVASLAGFEPATRCLEGSCSIHLSYRDTCSASLSL